VGRLSTLRKLETPRHPHFEPRLGAGSYCPHCQVQDLCGERYTSSACGHKWLYHPDAPHPSAYTDSQIRSELEFPEGKFEWATMDSTLSTVALAPTGSPWRSYGFRGLAGRDGEAFSIVRTNVLATSARDHQMERFWENHGHVTREMTRNKVILVLGPAFSTWWHRSPFDGLIERSRTAIVNSHLAKRLPTVPFIVWRNQKDLEEWARWFCLNQPSWIGVHSSTCRSNRSWSWLLESLGALASLFEKNGHLPKLLLYGPSTSTRMEQAVQSWPARVAFASQRPWRAAICAGKQFTETLTEEHSTRPKELVLKTNIKLFDLAAHAARQ
jgi:hypothetical protein